MYASLHMLSTFMTLNSKQKASHVHWHIDYKVQIMTVLPSDASNKEKKSLLSIFVFKSEQIQNKLPNYDKWPNNWTIKTYLLNFVNVFNV